MNDEVRNIADQVLEYVRGQLGNTQIQHDNFGVTVAPASASFQPNKYLNSIMPSRGDDFYNTPLDDDARRSILQGTPRAEDMEFKPPTLGPSLRLPHSRRSDIFAQEIQYRLSGIARLVDWTGQKLACSNQLPTINELAKLLDDVRMLAMDAASNASEFRRKNFYYDAGIATANNDSSATAIVSDELIKAQMEHAKLANDLKRKNNGRPKRRYNPNPQNAQNTSSANNGNANCSVPSGGNAGNANNNGNTRYNGNNKQGNGIRRQGRQNSQ